MLHAVNIKPQTRTGRNPIHVMIELDMSSYCVVLREYIAIIRHIEAERRKMDLVSTNSILQQENEPRLKDLDQFRSEIFDRVLKEKMLLSSSVRGIAGEMHWTVITQLFKSQLVAGNESEKALAAQLELPEKPLVFECLESSFVEILKNSMDANIDLGTESGLYQDMKLMMNIYLELLPDSLVAITFKDNCGGFSNKYLSQFRAFIEEKQYLLGPHSTDKNTSSFYFGGRGRGIGMMCATLLDGFAITPTCNTRVYHPISCRSSVISIKNEDRGALIRLITSTAPVKKHMDMLDRDDSEITVSVSDQDNPVSRGEYLVERESLSSSSKCSTLRQQSFFPARRPVAPLNLAALEEAYATLSIS